MDTQTGRALREKQLGSTLLHYWTNDGKESCIVFLHPAFGDHTCFEEQAEHFGDHKLIIPDLCGHGKSKDNERLEKTSLYLHQILEEEGMAAANLVGVGVGAMLAQDYASRYPEQVLSLVCIGGYPLGREPKVLEQDRQKDWKKAMLYCNLPKKTFAQRNTKLAAYTTGAQEKYYQLNLKFPRSSAKALSSIHSMPCVPWQDERTYPLFICVGEYDSPLAIRSARFWSRQEPDSSYVEISGAGRLANMDNPLECDAAIEMALR